MTYRAQLSLCVHVCVCVCPQVRLEWPTDLAVNPLDNSLYVLDNNVVLQMTEAGLVRMVAGRPDHCPTPAASDPIRSALRVALQGTKAIAVSHQGVLYIAQTDDRKLNRIQEVNSNGEISVIAGTISECDCKIDPDCECFSGECHAPVAGVGTPVNAVPIGLVYLFM